MFRFLVPLLILALQYCLYRRAVRLLRESDRSGLPVSIVTGIFLLFNCVALFVFLQQTDLLNLPDWVRYSALYPLFIWQAATLFIGFACLISSAIKGLFLGIVSLIRISPAARRTMDQLKQRADDHRVIQSRRIFLRNSTYAFAGVSFAGTAYGMLVERMKVDVTAAKFTLNSLDPSFDGFTIGLISDVHSSINMPRAEMDKYVTLLNSLGCDLVVVNGDFVNSAVEEVFPFAEAFSNLRAPFGVFGVMGNHDYYNKNPDRVAREVNDCGVKLLFDEQISITRNGATFYLLGIDDVGNRASAAQKIKIAVGKDDQPNIPRILLSHRPYYLAEASNLGVSLVLSGHTHGGQIVLGRFGETVFAPASLVSPYVWGKYRVDNCAMYVSRGIGTVGVPVRINCPPEITRIILQSGTHEPQS